MTLINSGVKMVLFGFLLLGVLIFGSMVLDRSLADFIYLGFIIFFSVRYLLLKIDKKKLY